jgi:basic membrane protein A and related proteins
MATLFLRMPEKKAEGTTRFKVGLVFDVGGLGDKSFNDGAYTGLLMAKERLGADVSAIEPGDGSDRESALRMFAASGVQMVIGVGFIFTDDILQVARDYPSVSFVCIDMALRYDLAGALVPLPDNVVALKFREEQGSYLAGVLAATVSKTKKLGFVGGMDIPLIHKFSAGFRAGVMTTCPSCSLSVLFAGATPSAFKDPGGREMALSQYADGADIVYHAAGATGLGVFQAAREKNKLAIGVDSDQSREAPDNILTSMVKRIDLAVLDTIRAAQAGEIKGGLRSLGLENGAVELVRNPSYFTSELDATLAETRTAIIAGKIVVPDHD